MKKSLKKLILLFFALNSPISFIDAQAQESYNNPAKNHVGSFVLENDLFANQDSGYTDGIRLSWLSSSIETPFWAKKIANNLSGNNADEKHISLSLGQDIFTPSDLNRKDLITNDRPYAGWLYGSLGVVYNDHISDHKEILNSVLLTIGVVGPLSGGQATQKWVHHIVGSPQPQGWGNQLHNEPGIDLTFERKWKNLIGFFPNNIGIDITPNIGMTLGNIFTNASLGTTWRLGYKLPDDYGPPQIRPNLPGSDFFIPQKTFGAYLFVGAYGRGVLRNIFLDGNSFRDSPSVKKNFFVADFQIGTAATYKDWRISYAHIFMTKEFEGQKHAPRFGSLAVSYAF